MDIINLMKKINAIGKYFIIVVVALNLVSLSYADASSASSPLSSALKELCLMSQIFLGAAAMILIVLAGTTYAIGQVLGAETRARAAVWATAMLTGAVIGAVIYIVTPVIVRALLPSITASGTGPCDF
jgi:hypothetical protein